MGAGTSLGIKVRFGSLHHAVMSALGQKQTCAVHKPMSAKCQKRTCQYVRNATRLRLWAYGALHVGECLLAAALVSSIVRCSSTHHCLSDGGDRPWGQLAKCFLGGSY